MSDFTVNILISAKSVLYSEIHIAIQPIIEKHDAIHQTGSR